MLLSFLFVFFTFCFFELLTISQSFVVLDISSASSTKTKEKKSSAKFIELSSTRKVRTNSILYQREHIIQPIHNSFYMAPTNTLEKEETLVDNTKDKPNIDKEEIDPRLISATACIRLPCSCNLAYDTWSDMTKQPTWSKFLDYVKYTNPPSQKETEWSAKILRVPIRWKAETTVLNRPKEISWKSISGVPTSGSVEFQEVDTTASTTNNDDMGNKNSSKYNHCDMTLSMTVQAPRVFARLFRTTYLRDSFFRDKIVLGTLKRFRDVVMNEKEDNDNRNEKQD